MSANGQPFRYNQIRPVPCFLYSIKPRQIQHLSGKYETKLTQQKGEGYQNVVVKGKLETTKKDSSKNITNLNRYLLRK